MFISNYRDWQEHLKDTDQGASTIDVEDPPVGLDLDVDCPVCGEPVGGHDQVRVADASGEIFACLAFGAAARWQTLPTDCSGQYE